MASAFFVPIIPFTSIRSIRVEAQTRTKPAALLSIHSDVRNAEKPTASPDCLLGNSRNIPANGPLSSHPVILAGYRDMSADNKTYCAFDFAARLAASGSGYRYSPQRLDTIIESTNEDPCH
ncbi:hypothetical protein CFIMG_008602RA00001 [Ceratocystis fimbriata CBS 114723]|uniref:Uncharacterized protein n=1 Tax=Ceratocystis fimbriata CBS 114723 TaxID=1035309 RepID=A0A2C5X149_9PEZI|nr:hypothetical protein CFIMG_008602RA00001 [Ceratocystis fimbriata CBS 114723]